MPAKKTRARARPTTGPAAQTIQLKVTLLGVEPPIWRRFQVPDRFDLLRLHEVLQEVMGWSDSHLHQFIVDDEVFGIPEPDNSAQVRDSRKVTVGEIAAAGARRFAYEYDFGDGWEHEIEIEKIIPGSLDSRPVCVEGEQACPPENCGGPEAFGALLKAIRNPRSKRRREFLEWLGGEFDPEAFNLAAVNQRLRLL